MFKKGQRIKIDENLVGKTFGRWTILSFDIERSSKVTKAPYFHYWIVQCSCDKKTQKSVEESNLLKGKTKSCGCFRDEYNREHIKDHITPFVKARTLPPGDAAFNYLYLRCKRDAINKGRKFLLTKPQVKKIVKENCWYCGREPQQVSRHQGLNGTFTYNGLDRKDNTIFDYTYENSIACCRWCNNAKSDLSVKVFLNISYQIHKHSCKEMLDKERISSRNFYFLNRSPLSNYPVNFAGIFNSYVDHARNRSLVFDLSKDLFYRLTQQPCTYCGGVLSNHTKTFYYNGVDRFNNDEGYTLDNSVSCCKVCNQFKSDMTYEDFILLATQIDNKHNSLEEK